MQEFRSPGLFHVAAKLFGHAIEYLTDELVHEGGEPYLTNPKVQAIHTLMTINRQIYLACPIVPSLWDRVQLRVHRLLARLYLAS